MSTPNQVWNNYLKSLGEDPAKTEKAFPIVDHFCDEKLQTDNLYNLVIQGIKRATTASVKICEYYNEDFSKPGDYWILTNFDETESCVLQTVKSTIKKFSQITEEDAYIEGEGDKTLKYWREVHKSFFEEEYKSLGWKFSEDIEVVFEEFKVVYVDTVA